MYLRQFQECYNNFFENNIANNIVQHNPNAKQHFNYHSLSDNIFQLADNDAKWDQKLYQFAKKLAIKRSNDIFNGKIS